MYAADDFITGKLFTGEVFFKQSFICFSNCFGNSCGKTVQTMAKVRHLNLMRLAFFIVGVSFHVDKVDVGFYFTVFYIWNNDRTYCRTEGSFQFFKNFIEISVVSVELADKEHGSLGSVFCHLVRFFCADIHTGFARYTDQQAFCSAYALYSFAGKVKQSWGVDQVDLGAAPCKRSNRSGNRYLSLNFFRIIVANCVSVCYFSQSISRACFKQQSLGKRSFSRTAVSGQCNVSNPSCQILSHKVSPLSSSPFYGIPPYGGALSYAGFSSDESFVIG